MRRLWIGILLITSTSVYASRFGIHGGINIANMSLESVTGTEGSTNPIFGLILDSSLGGLLGFELDVNYLTKGYKIGTVNAQKLNYLEVPLLLKVVFPTPVIKPFLEIGPSLGFLLSASSETPVGAAGVDVKNNYNSIDLGLNFGGGIELSLGPIALLIDVRYQLGISDVSATPTADRNRGVQFMAGILFGS